MKPPRASAAIDLKSYAGEDRARWELMIANRGLRRSQPIWITPYRSTVPLRTAHDRFSATTSLSFFSPSTLFFSSLRSLCHSFETIPHAGPNFVTLPGGEHCGSNLLCLGINRTCNFQIRLVGVFARNRYLRFIGIAFGDGICNLGRFFDLLEVDGALPVVG